jgi:hypothetical protein
MSNSELGRGSALRRGFDRARFMLERFVLRGVHSRLLFAAAIVALVSLVAGAIAWLVDPATTEFADAIWWAFLRLTDPGYLGDDEGFGRRTVSTIVTVLGYVLFLGLLIAILTQWLTSSIAKLESGVTPVAISDHVIILGWTHRTPTIVAELLRTRKRVERFLERQRARQLRIVILSEHVDQARARQLREALGGLWNDRQVLLRSGSPLRLDHLERVAFRDAAVLILPGADFSECNPEAVDAETIKTLLSVATHVGESDNAPLAVAALYDAGKAPVARRAYAGESEVVSVDEIIGRIIAQSVWQHGLCDAFTELLTLEEGNAIYVRRAEGEVGARFGELRGAWPKAILLGTFRPDERLAALNPDPETVVHEEDVLVFVARRIEECGPPTERTPLPEAPPTALAPPAPERTRRVLILGWSRKVPSLLREFASYGEDAFEIDVVTLIPIEERERMLALLDLGTANDRVHHIEAGFTVPGVLDRLEPQRYDNVVLVASEFLAEGDQADAATVTTFLMLSGLLPEEGPCPDVLVELVDEENRFLFAGRRDDVIVSATTASYLLSQVSLRRELAAVYAELCRPRGGQLTLQPAAKYAPDAACRFGDLEKAASARGEIAVGIRHAGRLELNPDREVEWRLEPGDQLLVLPPARTA